MNNLKKLLEGGVTSARAGEKKADEGMNRHKYGTSEYVWHNRDANYHMGKRHGFESALSYLTVFGSK